MNDCLDSLDSFLLLSYLEVPVEGVRSVRGQKVAEDERQGSKKK